MATGLSSPLAVNRSGGAVTVSGSALIKQLLLIALRDCSSANPFQNLGLRDKNIFSLNDPRTVSRLRLAIKQIFVGFQVQQLAKLVGGDQGVSFSQTEEGAIDLEVKYVDLETDKPGSVNVSNDGTSWR